MEMIDQLSSTLVRILIGSVYPLALRQSLYFRLLSSHFSWPKGCVRCQLEFAPVVMEALRQSDSMHRQIAWLGFYELNLSRKIVSLARTGGILVDVGANIGYFTCLWTGLGTNNLVYAFEPSPDVCSMLRRNIEVNALQDRVKAFEFALGHESGTAMFDPCSEQESGWGGLMTKTSPNAFLVNVRRLDEMLSADVTVDVLKIDTEGADTWVLFGAERLLRAKQIKHVFFERNESRMAQLGIKPGEAERFLSDCGYRVSSLGASTGNELWATRADS